MTDLPRRAVTRSARLAGLPLGMAGRAVVGFGKRVGGAPAAQVTAEMQARTAAQLFDVLGGLKGGAMKFGQSLSMFESMVPEELGAPYRQTLTKLQDSAPAMPAERVHEILAAELGPQWRDLFQEFTDEPAAAASIGQVHRAVWGDGRPVAVKVQYPGAAKALLSDLNQVSRVARISTAWIPGLDIVPILDELKGRMAEELDYQLEGWSTEQMADAFADDPDVVVPGVVDVTARVLVTEWIDGRPLSQVIAGGTRAERDAAAERYLEFIISAPGRSGLLHADPHPGNFRMLPDGRLGVLDLGAVSRLPDGLPPALGLILSHAAAGEAEEFLEALRDEGFVKAGIEVDAQAVLEYLRPFLDPLTVDEFRFTREWLREVFGQVSDPLGAGMSVGMRLNLPPQYLLIHRAWLGAVAVLCQIEGSARVRQVLDAAVPGAQLPPLGA